MLKHHRPFSSAVVNSITKSNWHQRHKACIAQIALFLQWQVLHLAVVPQLDAAQGAAVLEQACDSVTSPPPLLVRISKLKWEKCSACR